MKFIDKVEINIFSGAGGKGIASFTHTASRVGRPDGGNGGNGGNVYLIGDSSINTLSDYSNKGIYKAGDGKSGSSSRRCGKRGDDLYIKLPLGTQVRDVFDNLLFDIVDETEYKILSGGNGGSGNYVFKSSINRSPHKCTNGEPGVSQSIKLRLKLLADVAIIGMPNAGKSALIRTITNSKSNSGEYSFTTTEPYIGVVSYDYDQFTVLDLPGMIYNSSQGRGKGIEILSHAERCNVLLHVVDGSEGFENALSNYKLIRNELSQYSDYDFNQKSEVIAINKYDKKDWNINEFIDNVENKMVVEISCVDKYGIDNLIKKLYHNHIEKGK